MIGLLNCKLINSALILQTVILFFLNEQMNVNEQIFAKIKAKKTKRYNLCFLIVFMYFISTRLKENFNPTYINIKVHFELHIRKMILSLKFNETLDHLLKQYLFFFSFKC